MENHQPSSSQNEKGKHLARKPSFRKPPEVRQTLTSKFRLLKGNPLLMYELEKKVKSDSANNDDKHVDKPLKTLVKALDANSEPQLKTTLKKSSVASSKPKPKPTKNKPKVENSKQKPNFSSSNTTKLDFMSGKFLSSTTIDNNGPARKNNFNRPTTCTGAVPKQKPQNNNVKSKPKNCTKPVRRSLSAQHFEMKKAKSNCNNGPRKSQSFTEIRNVDAAKGRNFSTITEESSLKKSPSPIAQTVFRTPSAQERRSVFFKTPNTLNNRRSLFLSTPTTQELSNRLNDWLKRRGKSLCNYHHLKCFGIHGNDKKDIDDDNKENIEGDVIVNGSDEDLRIIVVPPETKAVTPVNLETVAKEALVDLHKLITDGYPSEQCEAWLKLIKQKYKKLEEEPEYWECRAAVEQQRGNINLAVECYKTAIIQGAEVRTVDASLDHLLQKFSLLNINKDTHENKDRERIVRDARNIFKSSIIQFAVQQRTLKIKNKEGVTIEKQFIATPVRRSTRLSRSAYTSTPGVKVYSSLKEVESPIRNTLSFQHNKAFI